jgi:hypothetical protein
MDWLTRLFQPHRTPDEERRAKRTDETLTLVDDFVRDMRESIRSVRETNREQAASWEGLYDDPRRKR